MPAVPTVPTMLTMLTVLTLLTVLTVRSLPRPPRLPRPLHQVTLPTRQKIGLFCNVPTERVLSLYDVPTIYRVPLEMLERSTPQPHHTPTIAPTERGLATEGSHPGLAGRLPGRQALLCCPATPTHALLTRVRLASDRPRHPHLRAARPHLLPRTAAQRSGRGGAGRRGVGTRDRSASGRGDRGCPAAAAARRSLCRGVGSHGTLTLALALSLALALTLAVSLILTLPPNPGLGCHGAQDGGGGWRGWRVARGGGRSRGQV